MITKEKLTELGFEQGNSTKDWNECFFGNFIYKTAKIVYF